MKCLNRTVLVFSGLAFLAACSKDGSSSVTVEIPQPQLVVEAISVKEIADRVEQAYRESACICVHAEIRQEPLDGDYTRPISGGTELVTVDSVMTKDSFLTRVFDALGDPIREFRLKNGKIQECTYLVNEKTGEMDSKGVEYIPAYSHGIDDPKLETPIDCLIDAHTFSWASVPTGNNLPIVTDRARTMRAKIEGGQREPDLVVEHVDCYVFRQKIPSEDPAIEHIVYIDKETYDVRRWDTILSGVLRKRQYGIVRYKELPLGIPFLREDATPAAGKM